MDGYGMGMVWVWYGMDGGVGVPLMIPKQTGFRRKETRLNRANALFVASMILF